MLESSTVSLFFSPAFGVSPTVSVFLYTLFISNQLCLHCSVLLPPRVSSNTKIDVFTSVKLAKSPNFLCDRRLQLATSKILRMLAYVLFLDSCGNAAATRGLLLLFSAFVSKFLFTILNFLPLIATSLLLHQLPSFVVKIDQQLSMSNIF